jgi:hypothetical protein
MDVAGAYPIVPLAVAGDPACMVSVSEDDRRTRPTFRLVFNYAYSGSTDHRAIEYYGAALAATIDAWESQGARCEIVALYPFAAETNGRPKASITITLKRAADPLDLDRLAFATMHPAFLRRIGFALVDRRNAPLFARYWQSGTYGNVTNRTMPEDLDGPQSLYIPVPTNHNAATPEIAAKTLETLAGPMLEATGHQVTIKELIDASVVK